MKRPFVILLGFGLLVLGSLILILNAYSTQRLTQDGDIPPGTIIVPTATVFSNRTNQANTTIQSLVNDTSLLSNKDRSTLKTIQLSLPVEDSDIAIAYSPITEQFIVQKKTPKADELFNQFLENNQLTDLYAKHPAYFVVSNKDLRFEIIRIENEVISLIDDREADDEANDEQSTTPKLSALSSLLKVFSPKTISQSLLMQKDTNAFNIDLRANSPLINPSISNNSTVRSTSMSVSNLDQAVKKSCYNFKMNKCGGVGSEITNELRPGVTNGTYPVDNAVVNELFSNPNAVGLRNRRWQFEKGMIHPKLVRFLNEFVKSNTLERHLGMAGGADRCCARNSKTKTPAAGCRLTPHRLGVAIDLDTLNGSRVIKSKVNDPGMRKAMDWINAQTGDLRPDSVTMSDIFTGLYPFHPDSGHRDHLHVDFSRSLNCK